MDFIKQQTKKHNEFDKNCNQTFNQIIYFDHNNLVQIKRNDLIK